MEVTEKIELSGRVIRSANVRTNNGAEGRPVVKFAPVLAFVKTILRRKTGPAL